MTVLEHMPTFEQALNLLHECNRVLKLGGIIALEVPDYLRAGIDFYAWDYTHSFITTPFRIEQILHDAGFRIKRIINFTGSISLPVIRWPIDLTNFAIHTRLVYWLAYSLGLQSVLCKFHKTFEPNILVIANKV